MTALSKTVSPPLRWGFLVSGTFLALFLGLRFLWVSSIESVGEGEQLRRQQGVATTVRSMVTGRLNRLADIAVSVTRDTALLRDVASNNPQQVVRGNDELEHYRTEETISIQILDPKGTPLAWSGRSLLRDASPLVAPRSGDTIVVLNRLELHSSVSVGIAAPQSGLVVVVSEPFELNVPVSNRFVHQKSMIGDIAAAIGRPIQVLPGDKALGPSSGGWMRMELNDLDGKPLASVLVSLPNLEEELQSLHGSLQSWIGLSASFLLACIALALAGWAVQFQRRFLRIVVLVLLLWAMRMVLLLLETPALLIGGLLFDPSVFASPFPFGLASSLGETLITVAALAGSVLIVFRELGGPVRAKERNMHKVLQYAILFLTSLFLMLVLRGYGAALRSFVYDSTLQYVDPASLFPDAGVVVMYAIVLILTFTLTLFFVITIGWMLRMLRNGLRGGPDIVPWTVLILIYSLAVLVFSAINRVPQFPGYFPFLMLGCTLAILLWLERRKEPSPWLATLPGVSFMMLAAFILSVPVLDQKVHDKENDRLRVYADELVRPVDAWLSFVVSESFRGVGESLSEVVDKSIDAGTAFPVWSQTLLSREGYNSALVFYSIDGEEISRFSVGLTNYEQTQLLTRLFEVAEERLNVVERRVPEGLIKYYGMWGTIRNEAEQPVAIAAVLLSASERALFRGEAPDLLRTIGPASRDLRFKQVGISEYQNGYLVASNDDRLVPGAPLAPPVRDYFAHNGAKYYEREEYFDDRAFETLYVRDESQAARIVAIHIEEGGLRWHVYNVVKVSLIYAAAFLALSGILILLQWKQYRSMLFGFRGKLLLAFLLVALIPLIVFGYYNREFAAERQSVSASKRLTGDLDLLRRRIVASVSDEEDFRYGINSDYCETVASEYGIDFTVYRRTELHASSRPELYQSGLLDSRLPGSVFARIVVAGGGYAQTNETVGDVAYAVGYAPLVQNGRTLGVLSVPTLYRQQEVEAELAERNAFTLGVYGILLVLTTIAGVVLANQLSQPIRDLTAAAHTVGEGKLDVRLPDRGSGEIGELIGTFNEMVGELRKSRDELSRAERERAWKEMAKQVAHEIKNPLTPMKLSVQHLQQAFRDNAKDLDEIVSRVTRTITEQIDTLARIATEFSHFARMPERRFERVHLHQLLDETVQLFGEVRGIVFRTNYADTDPVLIADREELRRVFVNIVRNSVQAMEQGGEISITTELEDHRCRIQMSDTGIGIPSDLVSKVFQPNFSTKTDGMGLGLAIVRKVIEDLNGTISVTSTVGVGTTMNIILPLQTGPHA